MTWPPPLLSSFPTIRSVHRSVPRRSTRRLESLHWCQSPARQVGSFLCLQHQSLTCRACLHGRPQGGEPPPLQLEDPRHSSLVQGSAPWPSLKQATVLPAAVFCFTSFCITTPLRPPLSPNREASAVPTATSGSCKLAHDAPSAHLEAKQSAMASLAP